MKVNPIFRIMLLGAMVLSGCTVKEPQPAEAVQGPEPVRTAQAKRQPARHANTGDSAKGAGVSTHAEKALAGNGAQDAARSWVPSKLPGLPGTAIEVTRDVTFQELARQLGTTVDHLNAVNELQLMPETVIMRSSEIYVSRLEHHPAE